MTGPEKLAIHTEAAVEAIDGALELLDAEMGRFIVEADRVLASFKERQARLLAARDALTEVGASGWPTIEPQVLELARSAPPLPSGADGVLALLAEHPSVWELSDIAEVAALRGATPANGNGTAAARAALSRLIKRGAVERVGRGRYRVAGEPPPEIFPQPRGIGRRRQEADATRAD